MKKKLLLGVTILVSLLLLGACGGDEPAESSKDSETKATTKKATETSTTTSEPLEEHLFTTDDGTELIVELPSTWTAYDNPEELGEGNNASFTQDDNAYAAIAVYSASDYDGFDNFTALIKTEFEIPEDAETKDFSGNQFTGSQYIFEEVVDSMKMKYDIYVIESEKYFITAQAWTLPSKFDDASADLKEMVETIAFK